MIDELVTKHDPPHLLVARFIEIHVLVDGLHARHKRGDPIRHCEMGRGDVRRRDQLLVLPSVRADDFMLS